MRLTDHNNLGSNLGLHSGAAAGNLGLVKFALDHGQPIDSILNGGLPIHFACMNDHVSVVQYLIERGANVNAPRPSHKYNGTEKNRTTDQTIGTTGSTALHFAAAYGCTQTVELLLKNGAIVDVADKYGSTPLSVAIIKNHSDVVELLRTYGAIQAAEKRKLMQDDSTYIQSTSNLKYSKRLKEKSSKIAKKTKRPAALITTKFSSRTRRPSLPFELEKNDSTENVVLKRQSSKSMELPPHHLRLEISKDDGFTSDSITTIDSLDKPSIDMSYHSLDESDVKKLKSPTKERFRKSLPLTRQLTSTSLTSLASSSKSRSPDRRFSFSSSPATPLSNPSAISLLMTPPDVPGSPSTTSTAPTEYGGDPDYISLPPVIAEKKRRSTDPLCEFKMKKWNNNETNDDGAMTRSMSEGGGVNFLIFTSPNKKSPESFRPVGNNRKPSFTMKGLFGKLSDLILGKSI